MDYISNTLNDRAVKQKYLGKKGLVIFLALLSAFVPLSTDLYLPALPTMTQYFHVQVYQTNLTLILFFIFYSLATLVWGPLSDKYGRRTVLIIGLSMYAVASGLCAVSLSIYQLMFFRVLQAIGCGAASATATAIVKDAYQGKKTRIYFGIGTVNGSYLACHCTCYWSTFTYIYLMERRFL